MEKLIYQALSTFRKKFRDNKKGTHNVIFVSCFVKKGHDMAINFHVNEFGMFEVSEK